MYSIAEEATRRFEAARHNVGRFIGAPDPSREIVFAKNATEGLNLVAHTWGRRNLHAGDAILLTEMEHHANIVPWHMLAEERGLTIRWIPVDDDGRLVLDDLDRLVDGVKLVGISCMSNVLGTLNPISDIADAAHAAGAVVVADAAQSVPHLPTDVTALGVDFLAFSSHKMLGPTGIGVLWGRERSARRSFLPSSVGGEMILDVRKDGFTPNDIPWRFEAGTPPITEAIGLGAAVDYLRTVGMEAVRAHEISLTTYAMDTLDERFGADIIDLRPPRPEGSGRGDLLRLPRHPSPRHLPGARRVRGLRQGRPPLRQAPHAATGRQRHRPCLLRPLQRRVRCRRAGRWP